MLGRILDVEIEVVRVLTPPLDDFHVLAAMPAPPRGRELKIDHIECLDGRRVDARGPVGHQGIENPLLGIATLTGALDLLLGLDADEGAKGQRRWRGR